MRYKDNCDKMICNISEALISLTGRSDASHRHMGI